MTRFLRRILTDLLVVAALLPLACGGGGGGGGGTVEPPDDPPYNGTVDIKNNRFSPQHITISVGDSVTWRWNGDTHTVTQGTTPSSSQDGTRLFDVPERKNGTFGYRFTQAGTVPYFCRKHFYMSMDGTVKVEP